MNRNVPASRVQLNWTSLAMLATADEGRPASSRSRTPKPQRLSPAAVRRLNCTRGSPSLSVQVLRVSAVHSPRYGREWAGPP